MSDELEAVRTIRAPLGHLDAERAARMRSRALAGVLGATASTGTVLTDPTGGREARTDAAPAGTRRRPDHIVRLVETEPPIEIDLDLPGAADGGGHGSRRHGPGTGTGAGSGSTRRPVLIAAAAAIVLALVVALGVARNGEQQGVVADQPRPTSIADLAANAEGLVDRPLPPTQYTHIEVTKGAPFTNADATRSTHVVTQEVWANTARAGRVRTSDTVVVDPSGNTLETFLDGEQYDASESIPGFGSFEYDDLRSLPTVPTRLDEVLRSGAYGESNDYRRSVLIAELLMLDSTPPAVRAAVLELLASEGATFVPDATDRAGNTGFGIEITGADGYTTVFVTDRDGILIGSYDVVTGMPVQPENAVMWSSVVERDRTATLG